MSEFALRTNDGDVWPGQTVLVNGYSIAERLLEDAMFVLKVKTNDEGLAELVFSHVHEDSRAHVEGMTNAAKIAEWGEAAVDFMVHQDGDGLCENFETDLHWGDA